jgi:hypothetical protein
MKLLLFFFIAVVVIGSGEQKTKDSSGVLFESVGKDILSLCSRVVSLIIRKDLVIVGFLKQSKRRNKQRKLSKS